VAERKLTALMLSIMLFLTLLLGVIITSNLRFYDETVSKAREYMREGKYELAVDELEYACRSIRSMFIGLILWIVAIAPLAYTYYRTYVKKKQ